MYGIYLDELIVKPKINLSKQDDKEEKKDEDQAISQSSTSSIVASACINFQTEDPEDKNEKAREAAKRIN